MGISVAIVQNRLLEYPAAFSHRERASSLSNAWSRTVACLLRDPRRTCLVYHESGSCRRASGTTTQMEKPVAMCAQIEDEDSPEERPLPQDGGDGGDHQPCGDRHNKHEHWPSPRSFLLHLPHEARSPGHRHCCPAHARMTWTGFRGSIASTPLRGYRNVSPSTSVIDFWCHEG